MQHTILVHVLYISTYIVVVDCTNWPHRFENSGS